MQVQINSLAEGLKQQGVRLTPQRLAVLKALVSESHHPTAEQVYNLVRMDFPTTSLATIYKTLAKLIETGQLVEMGFNDGSNRYDLLADPHAHLICVRCKSIKDLEVIGIDQLGQDSITQNGYLRVSQRFDIYGVCPQCQKTTES